ncbi:MAG: HAMP domain-containing protein [Thermodesulfobacteriota bacterium]
MTPQLTKNCGPLINGPPSGADPRRGFWTEVIPVVPLTALRKRVILITCALLLVAACVNVQMLVDLRSAGITSAGDREIEQATDDGKDVATRAQSEHDPLGTTRAMSALLLMFTVACLGCIGYVCVRKTVSPPLETMTRTLREISEGNLNVSAPVLYSDEIGNLGKAINEVAANYQEVLLFAGTVVGNTLPTLEAMEKTLDAQGSSRSEDELRRQLDEVKGELERLGSVLKDFEYYEVYFDGRQALPRQPPAQTRCAQGFPRD